MVPKNRISARQDWDCEAALDQKADELREKIDELEEELRDVLILRGRGNEMDSSDAQIIAASHACLDVIAATIVIGGLIGLFVLAIINAGA